MIEFEEALEALGNEIDRLKPSAVKSNLVEIHGALYHIFEGIDIEETARAQEQNEIMRDLLIKHLSLEDRIYYERKFGIDLGVYVE